MKGPHFDVGFFYGLNMSTFALDLGALPRVSIRTMELIDERLLSCGASVVGFRWPTGSACFFRRPLARADGPKMGVLTQAFLDMRRSVGQSGQRWVFRVALLRG